MRCVECGCVKDPAERGWVTVLAPSGEQRIHYCCGCMEELLGRAATTEQTDDRAKEE